MNSLYNQLNTAQFQQQLSPTNQNPNLERIRSMMNQVRFAQNPKMAFEQMVQSNPQVQNVMNLVRQNGGDPKTAFYNLAKQKGVNPDDILSMLR